jgi:hypothetical protein
VLCSACGGAKAIPPVVTGDEAAIVQSAVAPVVMQTRAGTQKGDIRSTCDTGPCDEPSSYVPSRLSVVRSRELVTFRMPGADSMRARCRGRFFRVCFSSVDVLPFGCDHSLALESVRFSLARTSWRVSVPAGTYELVGRVYFTDGGGRGHGQLVSLGLKVDDGASPAIVRAPSATPATCP